MEQLYALDEVRDLVQRFRDLATFFHTSQNATNRLHKIQERLIAADRTGETELHARKRQPLKVLTDCPTRWNSARDLLARMVDLNQPLKGFHSYLKSSRGNKEFKPTPSLFQPSQKDWFTVKCMIALLDPIAATSELLGGQGYPTLALAFPCLRQIKRTLERQDLFDEEALQVENESFKRSVLDLMAFVRLAFVDLFVKRFADLPKELLWISYLDPRLTNMEGLTNSERAEARSGLIKASIALAQKEHVVPPPPSSPEASNEVSGESAIRKKRRVSAREGVFGKRSQRPSGASSDTRATRLETRCRAEVYRYLEDVEETSFDIDPLDW